MGVKSRVKSDGIETVLDSYYDWSYNGRIGPIYTCIEVAVFKDQLDLVKYLLDQGEDVNRNCWTDSFLKSPLIIAAGKGLLPMVNLLIKHGADVNQFGSGYRPLHLANSTTNTSKIIRTLCEHEVNVEAPNKFRGTPLRMAIQWRWLENIKELLRCGASLEEASDGWKQDTQWGKTEQNKFNESLKTANVQQAIKDGNELFYINECKSSPCKNGGTCTTSDGSYLCSCQDGWIGNNCNQDINECNSGPCKNGGTCTNSDGSYSCKCQDGWKGNNCNQGTDTDTCMDKSDNCGDMKEYGFCKGVHEEYMSKKCAKSCGTCAGAYTPWSEWGKGFGRKEYRRGEKER